jgi:hypothetical protein
MLQHVLVQPRIVASRRVRTQPYISTFIQRLYVTRS